GGPKSNKGASTPPHASRPEHRPRGRWQPHAHGRSLQRDDVYGRARVRDRARRAPRGGGTGRRGLLLALLPASGRIPAPGSAGGPVGVAAELRVVERASRGGSRVAGLLGAPAPHQRGTAKE